MKLTVRPSNGSRSPNVTFGSPRPGSLGPLLEGLAICSFVGFGVVAFVKDDGAVPPTSTDCNVVMRASDPETDFLIKSTNGRAFNLVELDNLRRKFAEFKEACQKLERGE